MVDLSIWVTTYNHGEYIAQALDSILMQKTKYTYEVLIGDDCSSDNTRDILRDYEKKYPGVFTVFYREHNMFNEKPNNGTDLLNRCIGRYVVALEGDDFWTSKDKIERQINFLDEHPEYIAVAHNCVVVDRDSKPNGETYPECKDAIYTLNHFASGILPGQLATFMHRNFRVDNKIDCSVIEKSIVPGDKLIFFTAASYGKVYCIQEQLSAYRHVTLGGSSFSANHKNDFSETYKWDLELLEYAYRTNLKKSIKAAEDYHIRMLMGAYHKGLCPKQTVIDSIKGINNRPYAFFRWIRALFRRSVLHKKILY